MEKKSALKEKKYVVFSHGLSAGRLSAVVIGKRGKKKTQTQRVTIKLVVSGEGITEPTY